MAYGEKYHVVYCDRNKKQFRLAIHEWDYTGESVRHKAARVPFSIAQETTAELKQGGIFPSRATVTLVSSKVFNMEELYTADERKYLVTHEPTDGSDKGKWYGNVIPNGFGEEMDNNVHYMVLTASDNLPTLKLKLFDKGDGTNYGYPEGDFEQSFMWVAKEALKKTGFLLPIWTMVDVKPALTSFIVAVKIGINVTTDVVTIMDSSREVKNNIQVGYRLVVTSGTGVGVAITIGSYDFIAGPTQDIFHITPLEELPGATETGNAVIELVPVVTDPSATYSDPLAITVHDIRVYVIDKDIEGKNYYEVNGTAMTTWDVLNNLAKQWNAKIYQNNGRWEIVRWNAHKVDSGNYDYFVYNSEGVEIGRDPFGLDVLYPCKSTRTEFRPFGHAISMDRVLGAVGVNYLFRYKTEGDSLINMIKNGNMSPAGIMFPPPTMDPGKYTPEYWRRYGSSSPHNMSLQFHGLPAIPGEYPTAGIPYVTVGAIGERFYYNRYLSAGSSYTMSVVQGDRLKINFWYRGRYRTSSTGFNSLNVIDPLVIRIFVAPFGQGNMRSQLVNAGATGLGMMDTATPEQLSSPIKLPSQWVSYPQHNDDYLAFEVGKESIIGPSVDNQKGPWFKYEIDVAPVPQSGNLVLEITGTGEPQLGSGYYTYSLYDGMGVYRNRQGRYSNREGDVAGFFIAKIVDPSSEKVSQIHPYWFRNDGLYTDSIDDIEVLTGDDDSPDHVSNIYVIDGTTRRAIKSWDSWASDFGWGALGLILAKSVMEQYYRPWRIIDGDFVAEHIDWATRFEFEQRPGERYVILRGSIDPINNRFSGTLAQVYDESTPELPPGGSDGGSTVEPNWQTTGIVRCLRDEDGLNTGEQEQQEVDANPASTTNGQIRWVNIGENTGQCPIGDPIDLLWGASVGSIDPETLQYFPVEHNGNDYTVGFDNDGSGKYLTFLHRASLGTVTSIRYENGGWQAYGNTPSWQYEADMIINGYTYKVMRQIYMSGVLNQLPLTFTIQ